MASNSKRIGLEEIGFLFIIFLNITSAVYAGGEIPRGINGLYGTTPNMGAIESEYTEVNPEFQSVGVVFRSEPGWINVYLYAEVNDPQGWENIASVIVATPDGRNETLRNDGNGVYRSEYYFSDQINPRGSYLFTVADNDGHSASRSEEKSNYIEQCPDAVYPSPGSYITETSPVIQWHGINDTGASLEQYQLEVFRVEPDNQIKIWQVFIQEGDADFYSSGENLYRVPFNFDNESSEPLQAGEPYRWNVRGHFDDGNESENGWLNFTVVSDPDDPFFTEMQLWAMTDPNGIRIQCQVRVNDPQGLGDIKQTTLTFPGGRNEPLQDNGNGYFSGLLNLEGHTDPRGFYIVTVEDHENNKNTLQYELTNHIEQWPDAVYPERSGYIAETVPAFRWHGIGDDAATLNEYRLEVHRIVSDDSDVKIWEFRIQNGDETFYNPGENLYQLPYNFDNQATEELQVGERYRWNVWAYFDPWSEADNAWPEFTILNPNADFAGFFNGMSNRIRSRDVDVPNPDVWNMSDQHMTIEAWVYPLAQASPDGEYTIVHRPSLPFNRDPWDVYRLGIKVVDGVAKPVLWISDGQSGNRVLALSDVALPVFEWTHLAGTYDGTNLVVYINGVLAGQTGTNISMPAEGVGLYIGYSVSNSQFCGLIDDIRLWNIDRQAGDILADMNHELNGDESGLMGYWKLDGEYDINGQIFALDETANQNHLVVQYGTQFVPFHPFGTFGTSELSVDISQIDFGLVEQGGTLSQLLQVSNPSNELLVGSAISMGVGIGGQSSAFYLYPGQTGEIQLYARALGAGVLDGNIQMAGNFPNTYVIPMSMNSIALQPVDANNISMWMKRNGQFAQNPFTGGNGFEYPKGSGKSAIYTAGVWIGATVGGEIRIAAASYGSEFRSGPIIDGNVNYPDDIKYRVYKIERGNSGSQDYLEWPSDLGAPVNDDGSPKILGDQTLFTVYNDMEGWRHNQFFTAPLGVEVQQTSFAYNQTTGPLSNTVFMRFRIINKSSESWNNAYLALWNDPDLGDASDDMVGMDVSRNLGYVYNGQESDGVYGSNPPAVGYDMLKGAFITHPAQAFSYFGNAAPYPNDDPQESQHAYYNMSGLLKDGSSYIDPFTGEPSPFPLNGDPVTGTGWILNQANDYRFIFSTGPFDLEPGQSKELIIAAIAGQGSDRLSSITEIRNTSDQVQNLFDSGQIFGGALENAVTLNLGPNDSGTLNDLVNSGAQLDVNSGADGAVIELASYIEPPAGVDDISNQAITGIGMYIDVQALGEIVWPVDIRLYYTASDLIEAGFSENDLLGLFYWSGEDNAWNSFAESGDDDQGRGTSTTGVNTANITLNNVEYEGYVYANAYHLTVMRIGAMVPILSAISAPIEPVRVNVQVVANVDFTDPLNSGPHTAVWYWGDGTSSSGVVEESSCSVTGTHMYTAAGVYTVEVIFSAVNNRSRKATYRYVVVYDPPAGFVTGGGWINSPAGAYAPVPTLTGKANFGFVSKYQKGATIPTGQTQFDFKVANMSFHSTNYQWLVVAGAKAKYKGTGTINGTGSYGFMLSAVDGQITGGGGVDKFRMKIWETETENVIYDNQMGDSDDGDATDAIEGGSIVVHKSSNSASPDDMESLTVEVPDQFAVYQNYPNPFNPGTDIRFDLPESSRVMVKIFNLFGQEIRALVDEEYAAGAHTVRWNGLDDMGKPVSSGVYLYEVIAGNHRYTTKMCLMR